MIVKVRLGSEEEHKEWDTREKLRPRLKQQVERVQWSLGEVWEENDHTFIFMLLCDDSVIKAMRSHHVPNGKTDGETGNTDQTEERNLFEQKSKEEDAHFFEISCRSGS